MQPLQILTRSRILIEITLDYCAKNTQLNLCRKKSVNLESTEKFDQIPVTHPRYGFKTVIYFKGVMINLLTGIKCNKEDVKQYYLSSPYYEPYSKVMMLSIGHIANTALFSYNVKLRDFIEDITYFNAGEHAHAILLDKQGVVWMHKNFPRMETIVEQPFKVYFQDIENVNETEILKSG